MKTQLGYIYRVTNLINGTVYVGQRRGEIQPWYLGSGTAIRNAVKKHGRDNFMLEFVQSGFTAAELDLLESAFIADARANGRTYNIRDGGNGALFNGHGANFGKRLSEITKARIKASNKAVGHLAAARRRGAKHSDESKLKMSNIRKGIATRKGFTLSQAHKDKLSLKAKARFAAGFKMPFAEETRKKISEAHRARWAIIKGAKP